MSTTHRNRWTIFTCIGILIGVFGTIAIKNSNFSFPSFSTNQDNEIEPVEEIVEEYAYGMRIDTFAMVEAEVEQNQFVSEILASYDVGNQKVHYLAENSVDIYDFRNFRAGNKYTVFMDNTPDSTAKYLVYERNPIQYVIYNLENPDDIREFEKPTETVEKRVEGTIESSLWNTLIDSGADPELAVKLAQVYQWTIDFSRINEGDSFQALFNEIYVDGEYYRTDSIKACTFSHNGKEFYAFYFDQGEGKKAGFYDEEGNSLKRAFLRAPVKYSRISSRYSGRRFHPVQKRYKAHLGTDYAAPHGTPIYSTANGTVIAASYTRGNGNYVKVKHNSTYTTQYLHMSKRAVKKGQTVSQGQVIGYVGSTGLATGPHVCYRFWKNGKQVDHLKLDLPAGDPIEDEKMEEFEEIKAKYLQELKQLESHHSMTKDEYPVDAEES